jgi:glycosyltransferase involved in cell wall biosynthesis
MIKVSVYIPTFNYAKFIEKAIDSVLCQTLKDWELIIIDDGSTDNTLEVIHKYEEHPQITINKQENKGLNKTNNIALRLSRGQYIMRLDADDYLDENALFMLSGTLDSMPDIDLIYPDYFEVDPEENILNLVRRKKIGEEVELLDLPAHGACTMFRKDVLVQVGGYYEEFNRQDGYELWLRFIKKHKPYNLNVPLFYYRQHPVSITKKQDKLLDTRRQIKRNFVEKNLNGEIPKTLGLIPVTKHSIYHYGEPFQEIAGKPLIWYTLNEAMKATHLDKIVLASDDEALLEYAKDFKGIEVISRPKEQATASTQMYDIINYALKHLNDKSNYVPDAVCTLYINTPLRKARHIDKAIDTMAIFDVDSVVSIEEELAFCYQHGKFGLQPIEKSRVIRTEKKGIYKENSSIFLSKTEVFQNKEMVGQKVGHISMLPEESIKINSAYALWLSEKIMSDWIPGKQ